MQEQQAMTMNTATTSATNTTHQLNVQVLLLELQWLMTEHWSLSAQ